MAEKQEFESSADLNFLLLLGQTVYSLCLFFSALCDRFRIFFYITKETPLWVFRCSKKQFFCGYTLSQNCHVLMSYPNWRSSSIEVKWKGLVMCDLYLQSFSTYLVDSKLTPPNHLKVGNGMFNWFRQFLHIFRMFQQIQTFTDDKTNSHLIRYNDEKIGVYEQPSHDRKNIWPERTERSFDHSVDLVAQFSNISKCLNVQGVSSRKALHKISGMEIINVVCYFPPIFHIWERKIFKSNGFFYKICQEFIYV